MLTLDQQVKKENDLVSEWLLNYEERLEKFNEWLDEAISIPSPQYDRVGGRGSTISDPTGNAAYRADSETERWLRLVKDVEERLPDKMQVYLKLRRKYKDCEGSRGWVVSLQQDFAKAMSRLTGKEVEMVWIDSRRTFWVWWVRIVEFAAREAAKRGLI